jgi:hypothetical protein
MTPCAVEGCGKPARTRGWCPLHYQRWRQHGDVHRRVQGGPRVPPGRDQAIAEARRAGATLAAISVQHGITPERVRQILARAPVENETEVKRVNHDAGCVARGAAVSAAHRARMRQHEQEVAKLYAAGHLSREIAQRIGISRHWVREIRRRLGLPVLRPAYAMRDQAIAEAYQAGVLLEEICTAHRVYAPQVYSALRRSGVPLRGRLRIQEAPDR